MHFVEQFTRQIEMFDPVFIPLYDGTKLAARIWRPADAENDPVPAILEYLPYRRRDGTAERDRLIHPYFAGHGYAAIRVDMRGSGDSDGVLLGEVHQGIPRSVGFAREIDLCGVRFEVDGQLLLEAYVRRPKQSALLRRLGLNDRQCALASPIGADHDRRWAHHGVSALMVTVVMGVHDVLDRQAGDTANRVQQLGPFGGVKAGIDHQDSFVSNQESGISARVVVRDVSVETGPDRLDLGRGRHPGAAKQKHQDCHP